MTGFGRSTVESPADRFEVEVRSTNGRQLDVTVRAPGYLGALEGKIREAVAGRVARGRVQVHVAHRPGEAGGRVEWNAPLLERVVGALTEAGRAAGIGAPSWADLLGIPGLVEVRLAPDDLDAAWASLGRALGEALDSLDAEREREGAAVAAACRRHVDDVRAALAEARARAPLVPEQARAAIERRLEALVPAGAGLETVLQEGRLEAEVALLASRADIAEEIDRIAAHLDAAEALLGRAGPAGAELAFLAQELQREWTTVAAKASDSAVAAASIRARAAVERLKEQAANLE